MLPIFIKQIKKNRTGKGGYVFLCGGVCCSVTSLATSFDFSDRTLTVSVLLKENFKRVWFLTTLEGINLSGGAVWREPHPEERCWDITQRSGMVSARQLPLFLLYCAQQEDLMQIHLTYRWRRTTPKSHLSYVTDFHILANIALRSNNYSALSFHTALLACLVHLTNSPLFYYLASLQNPCHKPLCEGHIFSFVLCNDILASNSLCYECHCLLKTCSPSCNIILLFSLMFCKSRIPLGSPTHVSERVK